MTKTFGQFLSASIGPLVTLGCTVGVMRYVAVGDESGKALGAAIAAAALFVLAQGLEVLPKKWTWWRRRVDDRAGFEGWWLQLHDDSRVGVFSCLYLAKGDTFRIVGDAFDPAGDRWADWHSTQLFFS